MTCHHCHTLNADDEHRCRHCGRRLAAADSTNDGLPLNAVTGNLAAAPARRYAPASVAGTPVREASPARTAAPAPRALEDPTGEQLLLNLQRGYSKVIPFESIPGSHVETYGTGPRPPRTPPPRRAAHGQDEPDAQQKLDFLPQAPLSARKLPTTVEAVIYCDAPVAHGMHRAVAAALDLSMVLIGCGFFLLTFHCAGGEFTLTRGSMAIFGAAFALIAMFYGLLWVLANGDSPGKRWTHLRLITFDGYPPERSHRLTRYLAACLGIAALGAGVLWALADEESLTWHDHISKTFLTVRESDSNFFRQR